MKTRSKRVLPFLLVAMLASMAIGSQGCGQRTRDRHTDAGAADSTRALGDSVTGAEISHPCPPQPTGPQVGRSDPFVNSAAPQLTEWAAMWSRALQGFVPDSLWRVGRTPWVPGEGAAYAPLVISEEARPGEDLARELLSLRSPDHRYVLSVDSYQVIIPGEESLIVGGEPDSRCSLIDLRDTTELVLQFSGTGGGYHWGSWLSRTSFAVGGWYDSDDFGEWKQGRLWLYSIRDSSVSEYQTRIVSAASYQAYEAAWQQWLLQRYRVWRRSRRTA